MNTARNAIVQRKVMASGHRIGPSWASPHMAWMGGDIGCARTHGRSHSGNIPMGVVPGLTNASDTVTVASQVIMTRPLVRIASDIATAVNPTTRIDGTRMYTSAANQP